MSDILELRPTLAQEDYARSLIDRIDKQDFHVDANRFRHRFDKCKTRRGMSQLISEMLEFLDEIEG